MAISEEVQWSPEMALIGGEGSSVSSSAIEGRAGVSEANQAGVAEGK